MIPLDGPFYDRLTVGQELPRQPGITIDGGLAALNQSLFGERLALTLDAELCEAVTGRPGRLASPGLVMQVSIGQSTTISRRAIANLFYRDVRLVRPVFVDETVRTVVTVAGLADGSSKPGRAPRGKVLVDIVTSVGDEPAVVYQRCPMLPLEGDELPGHADDLGEGPELDLAGYAAAAPDWDLGPLGPAGDWAVGATIVDPTRDVVDGATALVRATHNLAMIHRDAEVSPYPVRLVYGGHVVGLAQASLSRVLPGMATVLGWHGCDHTGPAFEGDLLAFRHTLVDEAPCAAGRVLAVRVEGTAFRAAEPDGVDVLDWTVVVLAP